jgi:hypothetical protein
MAERTIKVSMTADMAAAIAAYAEDQLNQEHDAQTHKSYESMLVDISVDVMRPLGLMERATKLYEDDRIALFEHPVQGDEVPMMAYFKEREHFDENCGFYDVTDVEEIVEDYRSAFKKDFS